MAEQKFNLSQDMIFLRELRDIAKSGKPINAANIKKAEETTAEEIMNLAKADNVKKLASKKSSLSSPPLYFKPSFVLDTLSPLLKVEIMLFDENNQPYYINLFSSDDDPLHNNLKSFTLEYPKTGVELVIEDVGQDIVELLMLKFSTAGIGARGNASSTIGLVFEFGWHVDPELANEYGDKIIFTQKVYTKFMDMEIKYEPNGTTEATIKCAISDHLLPVPYHTLLPYMVMTREPGIQIATLNMLQVVNDTFGPLQPDGEKKLNVIEPKKDSRDNSNRDAKYKQGQTVVHFARYLYFRHNIRNIEQIKAVIQVILKYFFGCQDLGNLGWLNKKKIEEGIVYAANKKQKKKKGEHASIFKKGTTILNDFFNKVKHISMSDTLGLMQGRIPFTTDNAPSLDTLKVDTTNKDLILSILSSQSSEVVLKKMVIKGRKHSTGGHNPPKMSIAALDRLITALGTITPELFIHPFVVWEYAFEKFRQAVTDFNKNNQHNQIQLHYVPIANIEHILPADTKADEGSYVKCLSTTAERKIGKWRYKYNDKLIASKANQHKFCKTANKYSCASNEDWLTYFEKIEGYMTVFYITSNQKLARKLLGNKGMQSNTIKSGQITAYKTPLKLAVTAHLMDPDEAVKNVQILKRMFELKLNTRKSTDGKELESLDKYVKELYSKLKTNAADKRQNILFYLRDFKSAEGIFHPSQGAQNIMQAYSFRGMENPQDKHAFNPGYPTVWEVNFPDVLSFEPEFKYSIAMRNLTWVADTPLRVKTSGQPGGVAYDVVKAARDKFIDSVKELGLIKKAGKKRTNKVIEVNKFLDNYEKNAKKLGHGVSATQYSNKHKVSFPLDWEQRGIYSGHTGEAIIMKKKMQEFRRILAMKSLQGTVTIKVIGDASFRLSDISKWIFLKFIKNDAALGIFTGIYLVNKIVQEISAGNGFTTTFTCSYLAQNSSGVSGMEELYDLWAKNDRITIAT